MIENGKKLHLLGRRRLIIANLQELFWEHTHDTHRGTLGETIGEDNVQMGYVLYIYNMDQTEICLHVAVHLTFMA